MKHISLNHISGWVLRLFLPSWTRPPTPRLASSLSTETPRFESHSWNAVTNFNLKNKKLLIDTTATSLLLAFFLSVCSSQDSGRVKGHGRSQLGARRSAQRKKLPEKPRHLQDAHQVDTKYPARPFSSHYS